MITSVNCKTSGKKITEIKRKLALCAALLSLFMGGYSQLESNIYSSYHFNNIRQEKGLSNNKVNAVCKDNTGFIWFGTNEGLNRFDGYNLKVYKHDPDDSTTICNNLIRSIFVDRNEKMWVTTSTGIDLYDQGKNIFKHVSSEANVQFTGLCWGIYELDYDSFLIASSEGLYFLDGRRLIATNVGAGFKLPENIEVSAILKDSRGNLYFGTSQHGLFLYDTKHKTIRQFKNIPGDYHSISGNWINCIYEDKDRNIWIGTNNNGLNYFNFRNSGFEWIDLDKNRNFDIRIRDIASDKFGRLWIGTYKGLYLKQPGNHSFTLYAHNKSGISEINNNSIYDIYIDNQDIMWIGTYSGGVSYCDLNQKKFKQYTYRENNKQYLNDATVSAIIEDENHNLWIGTEKGGLNFFDVNTKRFDYITLEYIYPEYLSAKNIKSLCMDKDNILWIGTYNRGIRCYNTSTQTVKICQHDPSDPYSLVNNTIYSISVDDSENMWIGTRGGIDMLPHKSKRFVHFNRQIGERYGFGNHIIKVVFIDSKDNILIGSGSVKGIYVLDKQDSSFVLLNKKTANYEIVAICEDKNGCIWAGSNEGLIYIDIVEDSLIHYSEKDGLPNNMVTAVLTDNDDNLWLTTSNGLVKFTNAVNRPDIPDFRVYNMNQGLKILQFADNSSFKSKTGELFFGGVNGFISFYPGDIIDNPHLAEAKITGLKILNKNVEVGQLINNHQVLSKSIYVTDRLKLSYKHDVVSFEFSAMHFAHPEENSYAYMLEGFDNEWNFTASDNRIATYTNLPGDEYVFKVKASNNDGIWNEEPAELKIRVLPPFWRRNW
ncbi:MAG: hypothetical protein JW723_08935, partial [Bacteroidales bacterium]|nr:hypothetical protein [Bacteroidales bacterium]